MQNRFRIIAGKWRGRKLNFVTAAGLRPSLDRVRETLFNWIQHEIYQARVLDLFAGSGSLGFEALSRGASHVTFVDNNPKVVAQLKKNARLLQTQQNTTCLVQKASLYLHQNSKQGQTGAPLPPGKEGAGKTTQVCEEAPFQIVFLDPPFHQNLLDQTCSQLGTSNLLADNALIYIECEQKNTLNLPQSWQKLKARQAGQLAYYLYQHRA